MSLLSAVKKSIINASEKGFAGEMLYYRAKYGGAKLMGALLGEKGYAKWFYHLYTGKKLNLDNPRTFNEKGWWLKLNNRNPLMTKCSDKYAVREYVKECGFEDILIPQFAVLQSADDLDLKQYKEPVIVKCTHNSGGHIFYFPDKSLNSKEVAHGKKRLNFILKRNASVLSLEWNYKNIPPQLVVEKMIQCKDGSIPLDCDFFCFNGEPKILAMDFGVVDYDANGATIHTRNLYDMDFNKLSMQWYRPNYDGEVQKPKNFDYMIEIAKKLSQPFPMCRVDLYNVDGKIYFGEITFYHGGCCQNIYPEEWEYKLGSWIDLDSSKIVRKK